MPDKEGMRDSHNYHLEVPFTNEPFALKGSNHVGIEPAERQYRLGTRVSQLAGQLFPTGKRVGHYGYCSGHQRTVQANDGLGNVW